MARKVWYDIKPKQNTLIIGLGDEEEPIEIKVTPYFLSQLDKMGQAERQRVLYAKYELSKPYDNIRTSRRIRYRERFGI